MLWYLHKTNCSDSRLRNISSGLVASLSSGINCDNAEDIGQTILIKMNDISFADVEPRKADRMKSLAMFDKKEIKNCQTVDTIHKMCSDCEGFHMRRA